MVKTRIKDEKRRMEQERKMDEGEKKGWDRDTKKGNGRHAEKLEEEDEWDSRLWGTKVQHRCQNRGNRLFWKQKKKREKH